ncbi:AMP-binding protein, partial [Pseudoalteromonas sp. JBTF-M23]
MNVNVLLAELKQQGIIVKANGDKLNIKSSVSPIPAEAVAKIRKYKEELLAFLNQASQAKAAVALLSEQEKNAGVAISAKQMSLWPLYKMKQSENYNIPMSFVIRGKLDIERLADSLSQAYRAYDALHSVFVEVGDQVLLKPNYDGAWQLEVVDGDESLAQDIYAQEQQRQFNLKQDCLFIARLVRITSEHSVLVLNFPHIIIDGWSISQLWRRVIAFYDGGKQVLASSADYLDYLAQLPADNGQAYWRNRLQGYEAMQLHSLTPCQADEAHVIYGQLSRQESKQLDTLAHDAQVSTFSAAFTLFAEMIGRYVGLDDIVISTPYASRDQGWLHEIVGYMVSMVPVRYRRGMSSKQVQQNMHQDMAVANTDFNALLPELGLQTHEGRHPLQQVVFAWQDGLTELDSFSQTTVQRMETSLKSAKFPLMLSMYVNDEGYQLKWEFDPKLISSQTVLTLQQAFFALIRQQGQYLPPAVATSAFPPLKGNVASRLAAQVNKSPEAVAVTQGDRELSYRQLWLQASSMALALQGAGVAAGDCVGVCLPQGPELAAALVGIVLTGAVYVPYAKDESATRLSQIAHQAELACVISTAEQAIAGVPWLDIQQMLTQPLQECPLPEISADSPIYINFSSGTTGEPKGIKCLHQGVIRLVENPNFMSLNAQTRMLSAAPATFDAFTLEFWGALLNGGQVCFIDDKLLDVAHLRSIIQQHNVNTAWLTAALFHTLVDLDCTVFDGLKQLLVGGDVVSPSHIRRVYDAHADLQIINGYGPTENTTFTCCFPIPKNWPADEALPVGKVIQGTQAYIVDNNGQLLPQGCIGEIIATGLGLAQGYLNQEQDVNRFITLDINGETTRAYRTGDFGYFDAQSELRFIGRQDQQVKINGFRVELEAISRCFNEEVEVVRAETIAVASGSSQQLVGFIKLDTACLFDEAKLLARVDAKLPSYMIPATLIEVIEFPLTKNGKVDRTALQQLYRDELNQRQSTSVPLSPMEKQIATVWQNVLQCGDCGPNAHFYRLGGNSLALLKVQNALEQKLNCQLSSEIFQRHTMLSELAKAIEYGALPADSDERSVRQAIQYPLVLSAEQYRLWLLHQGNPNAAYNIPLVIRFHREFTG